MALTRAAGVVVLAGRTRSLLHAGAAAAAARGRAADASATGADRMAVHVRAHGARPGALILARAASSSAEVSLSAVMCDCWMGHAGRRILRLQHATARG
eukprot:365089-Chlamydomonas_euryale.AAC.10